MELRKNKILSTLKNKTTQFQNRRTRRRQIIRDFIRNLLLISMVQRNEPIQEAKPDSFRDFKKKVKNNEQFVSTLSRIVLWIRDNKNHPFATRYRNDIYSSQTRINVYKGLLDYAKQFHNRGECRFNTYKEYVDYNSSKGFDVSLCSLSYPFDIPRELNQEFDALDNNMSNILRQH
jgi:hypothetical protein